MLTRARVSIVIPIVIPIGKNIRPVTADVHGQLSVSDLSSSKRLHSDPLAGNFTPFRLSVNTEELPTILFDVKWSMDIEVIINRLSV